jgi:hypothetical protein
MVVDSAVIPYRREDTTMHRSVTTLALGALLGGLLVAGTITTLNATAKPGPAPHYSVSHEIEPVAAEEQTYLCTFTVTNMDTGDVITSPRIKSVWGTAGMLKTGLEDGKAEVTCEIDEAGKVATMTASVHRGDQLVLDHRGTVQIVP